MLLSSAAEAKEKAPAEYPLPKEIPVLKTTFPTHWSTNYVRVPLSNGKFATNQVVSQVVRPEDLDLSKNFHLETPRYKIIKDKDWLPARCIGHVVSCFAKVIFLDWDAGLGLDAQRTKAAWSMVENNRSLDGLTVRVNHKAVCQDIKRLFTEEYLKDRNNWFARGAYGLFTTIAGETFASLRRGDYYNPSTSTAVLYSNIEGVSAHEFGHHKDFKRFESDVAYSISRSFPPTMLYQEAKASLYARDFLSNGDKGQFWRYLSIAFGTYLIGAYAASKRFVAWASDREPEEVEGGEALRCMITGNANFYGGVAAFTMAAVAGAGFWIGAAAFGAGFLGTWIVANRVLRRILPYRGE